MSEHPIALSFSHVNFSYPSLPVLEDVSFHFHEGEFIALVGPNGAGKSTLLKLMLGLEEPQSGSIALLGQSVRKSRSLVGYVPQHTSYDPAFPISVQEVVQMGMVDAKQRIDKRLLKGASLNALAQVELESLGERAYRDLSGGQRRRVLVARALVSQPRMLILDEPTANLDKESEQRLYATLRKLKGETTILIVTHDMKVVSSLVDRVFCIDAHRPGRVGRTVVQHTLEVFAGDGLQRVRHDVEIPGDFCQFPQEVEND